MPERLTIGSKNIRLIKEQAYKLYWLEVRPPLADKIAEQIMELFKQTASEVEAYTVEIGNYELYAVRSGNEVFVQSFRVPIETKEKR